MVFRHSSGLRWHARVLWLLAMTAVGGISSDGSRADEVTSAAATSPRYTFAWPLSSDAPAPRGGKTQGPPISIDTSESAAWRALQAKDLTAFERDRRAILALAGDYRVTFDFLEIVDFKAGAVRDRPYQSWGTERVYVDRDDGDYVSLVHLLEMRVVQADGVLSEPLITKHWREDWQYEPRELIEFQGFGRWQKRSIGRRERAGRWSQMVDQVDESPRYASIGAWQHSASFSTWSSGTTWRPLPRRELSVRKDYQVLTGTNRVTVAAQGAVQEENNLKTVLTADRQLDVAQPYLAREYGVARYERLRDPDFAAADRYYERTREFWSEVHAAWLGLFRKHAQVTFTPGAGATDPIEKLFGHADQLAGLEIPAQSSSQTIHEALQAAGAPLD